MHDPLYRDLMTNAPFSGWVAEVQRENGSYKPERVVFQIPGKELPRLEGVLPEQERAGRYAQEIPTSPSVHANSNRSTLPAL